MSPELRVELIANANMPCGPNGLSEGYDNAEDDIQPPLTKEEKKMVAMRNIEEWCKWAGLHVRVSS